MTGLPIATAVALTMLAAMDASAQPLPRSDKAATRKLTGSELANIRKCALVFHLKEGMTNADAQSEIDAAYTRFFDCIRKNGLRPGGV